MLDRKGRVDMDLNMRFSISRLDFFRMGLVTVSLRDCGTEPEVRELEDGM